MASAVKLKVSRRGSAAKYLAEIARKMTGSVKVGFLAGATYPEDYKRDQKRLAKLRVAQGRKEPKALGPPKPQPVLNVAQVAYWGEYGKTGQKARPFMRNTIAEKSKDWGGVIAATAATTNDGQKILRTVGTRIKDDFVSAIKNWPADNSPVTVAVKGFNHGLIDRGIMQRAVDFELQK